MDRRRKTQIRATDPASDMNLEEVTETVLRLEDELDPFEWTAGGGHYRERIRFPVNRELRKELGRNGELHTVPAPARTGEVRHLDFRVDLESRWLRHVRQHHDWESIVAEYISEYQRLDRDGSTAGSRQPSLSARRLFGLSTGRLNSEAG